MTYKEHYKAFSQNVEYAARILQYYLRLSFVGDYNSDNYKALNYNARFWTDYNFMAVQTVIIFLGKIFDTQNKTHNLTKMLDALALNLDYFSRENLRARKIEIGGLFDGLNDYIKNAHELNVTDVDLIKSEAQKAEALWKKFKPLRHQIYAHNQMLTDEQRKKLYTNLTYTELDQLVQILLNIVNVLYEIEFNGTKPDFNNDYARTVNRAKEESEKLLEALVKGVNNL